MTIDNNSKKVIIVGGGIAGLSLANYLKSHHVPFEVYERDEAPDSRFQGWGITLHFGLNSLKECMPTEAFENLYQKISANTESDNGVSINFMNANTGEIFMSNTSKPGTSYRANRGRLRKWLMKEVEDHIYWNKRITHYKENTEEGSVTAYFEDGTEVTGAVLVGTDGAQSPVACQMIGGKEKFNELTTSLDIRSFGVLRWISEEEWSNITENPVQITVLNGQQNEKDDLKEKTFNMFVCLHNIDRTRSENPIQVLWTMSRYDSEGAIPKFSGESENAECLALLKFWAANGLPEDSPYRSLILDTPGNSNVMPINIRERIPTTELLEAPKRRVVLVGDAAHPMTMFRGEGGNHAIVDAVNLGTQLNEYYQGSKTLDEALQAYYVEMIPRSQKAVKESHDAAVLVHCNPALMMQLFKSTQNR